MSAKGLPPAVRLDPLPLVSTYPSGHKPFETLQAHKIHSPTSILNPSHNSPPPQAPNLARGLTPIIITPESSSRPHTPSVGGGCTSDRSTPGLASLHALAVGKPGRRIIKFEPVELDPILPSVKQERKVISRAVRMDEDEGSKPPQLPPTPCMTPVLHPVDGDLIEGERGEEVVMMIGDKSPRAGRTIVPAFRSRPDQDGDPAAFHRCARNLSLSDLASVAERERLVFDDEDGRRGRTKERRRNSRFREEKGRYKPYDAGMRAINCRLRLSSTTMSHTPQQQPLLSPALPPIAPPHPIPKAADHLIHLFNTELQNQIQAERESLRSEYENLVRERNELQRERDLMRVERDQHMSYVDATKEAKEREAMALREENLMLKNRVEELQSRLENMLREPGRRSPRTS